MYQNLATTLSIPSLENSLSLVFYSLIFRKSTLTIWSSTAFIGITSTTLEKSSQASFSSEKRLSLNYDTLIRKREECELMIMFKARRTRKETVKYLINDCP